MINKENLHRHSINFMKKDKVINKKLIIEHIIINSIERLMRKWISMKDI